MMKESIKSNAPRFSARRMVKEYVAKYYPLLLRAADAEYARIMAVSKPPAPAWEPRVPGEAEEGSE